MFRVAGLPLLQEAPGNRLGGRGGKISMRSLCAPLFFCLPLTIAPRPPFAALRQREDTGAEKLVEETL